MDHVRANVNENTNSVAISIRSSRATATTPSTPSSFSARRPNEHCSLSKVSYERGLATLGNPPSYAATRSPQLSVSFARVLAQAAAVSKDEHDALLPDSQYANPTGSSKPASRSEDYCVALVDWIGAHCPDPKGRIVAALDQICSEDFGVLGLALKMAPTLRAAIYLLQHYSSLIADGARYRLEETSDAMSLIVISGPAPGGLQAFRTEFALLGILRLLQDVTGYGLHQYRVTFQRGRTTETDRYEQLLPCRVQFMAKRDAIVIHPGALDTPNPSGDASVCAYLLRQLNAAIKRQEKEVTLTDAIREYLVPALERGVPKAAEIARAMGMSERTLYRRLADESVTYRSVLQDARAAVARDLLLEKNCSIADVAFRTGFAEQSTFTRAFKRWIGQTPTEYRTQAGRV